MDSPRTLCDKLYSKHTPLSSVQFLSSQTSFVKGPSPSCVHDGLLVPKLIRVEMRGLLPTGFFPLNVCFVVAFRQLGSTLCERSFAFNFSSTLCWLQIKTWFVQRLSGTTRRARELGWLVVHPSACKTVPSCLFEVGTFVFAEAGNKLSVDCECLERRNQTSWKSNKLTD